MAQRRRTISLAILLAAALPTAGLALAATPVGPASAGFAKAPYLPKAPNLPKAAYLPKAPYLQCVPYARSVSGIAIYGDAHSWWAQAAGRFVRNRQPAVGAVLAFRPHGAMRLGHVAAVSRIVDARTVLVRHANWSPIGGARGQIENDVPVRDVSAANDWSEVRVWYAPSAALGTTAWPTHGFIHPAGAAQRRPVAAATPASRRAPRSLFSRTTLARLDRQAVAETKAAGSAPRLSYALANHDDRLAGGQLAGGQLAGRQLAGRQ